MGLATQVASAMFSYLSEVEAMAKLKIAAQVCEMLLLLAGIALLSGTQDFKNGNESKSSSCAEPDPDDISAWGVG